MRSSASMTTCSVASTVMSKCEAWIELVGSQCEVVDVLDVQSLDIEHHLVVVFQRSLVVVVVAVVVNAWRRLPTRCRTIVGRPTCTTYRNKLCNKTRKK